MTELLAIWLRWRPGIRPFYWLIMGRFVCGENLQEAANNTEELEETAKLIFILGERPIRYLTTEGNLRS
ncbi:sugar aldolase [Salmonella enterica subsp. enterica serovar Daytona]|uniref:Sugar aldolase n=1 Tax=Salmonella enterica subsp. enterica serovar Daytona TaxID=1962639 RepID=A0A447JDC5_SALET|nr:sugar aldolase [Salmonella enterica subsp. enterica serovar Daytona]